MSYLSDFDQVYCDYCKRTVVHTEGSMGNPAITREVHLKMMKTGLTEKQAAFMCPKCNKEKYYRFSGGKIERSHGFSPIEDHLNEIGCVAGILLAPIWIPGLLIFGLYKLGQKIFSD